MSNARTCLGRHILVCKISPSDLDGRVSTVQEIKTAIARLPLEERALLVAELCGWTNDAWDRRMQADAAAGKFNSLNEDSSAYEPGRTKPLDDILEQS